MHSHDITFQEMNDFLVSNGFRMLDLPYKNEYVYGKRMDRHDFPLSLRVYTSIGKDDSAIGLDSIRLVLFTKYQGKPYFVMGLPRIYRAENWKEILLRRIEEARDKHLPVCDKCQSVLLQKSMQQFCPSCESEPPRQS